MYDRKIIQQESTEVNFSVRNSRHEKDTQGMKVLAYTTYTCIYTYIYRYRNVYV